MLANVPFPTPGAPIKTNRLLVTTDTLRVDSVSERRNGILTTLHMAIIAAESFISVMMTQKTVVLYCFLQIGIVFVGKSQYTVQAWYNSCQWNFLNVHRAVLTSFLLSYASRLSENDVFIGM